MAGFVHKELDKCRRNAATIASVSFLVLVLVLSVFVFLATRPHDDAGIFFFPGASGPGRLHVVQQGEEGRSCERELQSLPEQDAKCRYLSSASRAACSAQGYVDYLRVFYCGLGRWPWLGGLALALWLVVLFYLLGDTASQYFCKSLEGLSAELRLPPAVAGATLLSLGNGAPDVLSSVVAFTGSGDDAGDVGLSSVLGGALFVATVVAGVVAIVAERGEAPAVIERRGFVRDACFLLVALCYLLAVLLTGSVTVWAATSFLSLYAAYVVLVSTSSQCCNNEQVSDEEEGKPCARAFASDDDDDDDLAAPLLLGGDPSVSYSKLTTPKQTLSRRILEAPLYLPRRLTIPDIAAHRWSKPCAVASALFAPILLAGATSTSIPTLVAGLLAGAVLAAAASHSLPGPAPPATRWARLPWLAGGFLMSVLWSYVLARELVALLVATGVVAGVRASVLGATVLAWGNSLGDLVADVAMAAHSGAQTAVAGCYAGPAFNTVVGLGLSLTLAAAACYPEPYTVPVDASMYQALGFLAAALPLQQERPQQEWNGASNPRMLHSIPLEHLCLCKLHGKSPPQRMGRTMHA